MDTINNKIDETLLNFSNCDIFTPDNISQKMSLYLYKEGNLLEPSVGDGQLLKFINTNNYENIDIYDIKLEYLNKIENKNNINKYHEDFLTKEINKKYKNIILNPPYIKIQNLSEEYRKNIKQNWKLLNGNIDIYYVFLLKCIELLDDDGIMISITPNSYLYNKGSLKLRKYLIENKLIKEIIDYKSKQVFSEVKTYCCITIFSKENKENLIYNNKEIKYSNIDKKEYNIFTINKENNKNIKTLNDICIIRNGIATLRDKIYIHKNKLYDEPCWKEITNSKDNKWCIYPYDKNTKIIEEEEFKNNNPLTYKYLENHKNELLKRDKGKKKYIKWYSYGRTQSLKISEQENMMYIPTLVDPDNIKYKIEKTKLFVGCLGLEIKDNKYSLEMIKEYLEKNKQFIIDNSPKRNGGWLTLSSSVLKRIEIIE